LTLSIAEYLFFLSSLGFLGGTFEMLEIWFWEKDALTISGAKFEKLSFYLSFGFELYFKNELF